MPAFIFSCDLLMQHASWYSVNQEIAQSVGPNMSAGLNPPRTLVFRLATVNYQRGNLQQTQHFLILFFLSPLQCFVA